MAAPRFAAGDMVRYTRDALVQMGYPFPYGHRAMDLIVLEDCGEGKPTGLYPGRHYLVRYEDSPEDKLGSVILEDFLELIPAVPIFGVGVALRGKGVHHGK